MDMSDPEHESQPDRGFKVEDRRRFSPQGDPRPDATDAPVADEQPPKATIADATESPKNPPPQIPELTFSTFTISLSTQALVHLGEIPSPLGEPSSPDLPAAQQLIDILGMLEEKTRGNLDAAEHGLLESVLYDLRLRFVEQAKRQRSS